MTKTTVQLDTATRDRLNDAKRGKETHDDVINRALDALSGEEVEKKVGQ